MLTTTCEVFFRPESDALRFLPEGPYSLADGRVSWVGIQHGATSTQGSINLLNPVTRQNESHLLPGRPGFAFPTRDPDVFVAGVERCVGRFNLQTEQWTAIVSDIDSAVTNTIINDGVCFDGNLIFGCKELEFKTKKAGLYLWRHADQRLIQLRDNQICSNGKAVIPGADGGLVLIDIDSPSKTITRGVLDLQAGTLDEQVPIVDLSSEDIFPDGMIVTPDCRSLIVALYDPGDPSAGAARQYSLLTGELESVWLCPGSPRVTCPQLVMIDGAVKLFLTTAIEHMDADQLAQHPNAGCLFVGDTAFTSIGDQPLFV